MRRCRSPSRRRGCSAARPTLRRRGTGSRGRGSRGTCRGRRRRCRSRTSRGRRRGQRRDARWRACRRGCSRAPPLGRAARGSPTRAARAPGAAWGRW
ncbi:MAG: hypothetical protein E6R04_10420 [Spirochaetes bacterium]|nr:MAG: hypothetical protein E6R04_10420 [Spirochaetota bacterium]